MSLCCTSHGHSCVPRDDWLFASGTSAAAIGLDERAGIRRSSGRIALYGISYKWRASVPVHSRITRHFSGERLIARGTSGLGTTNAPGSGDSFGRKVSAYGEKCAEREDSPRELEVSRMTDVEANCVAFGRRRDSESAYSSALSRRYRKSHSGLIGVWPGCYWARPDPAYQISASASRREEWIAPTEAGYGPALAPLVDRHPAIKPETPGRSSPECSNT